MLVMTAEARAEAEGWSDATTEEAEQLPEDMAWQIGVHCQDEISSRPPQPQVKAEPDHTDLTQTQITAPNTPGRKRQTPSKGATAPPPPPPLRSQLVEHLPSVRHAILFLAIG